MCVDTEIQLLTAAEVAELFRVKIRMVQAWAATGELTGAIRVGRFWLFRRDELLESLRKPTAPVAVPVKPKIIVPSLPRDDSKAWLRDFFYQKTFDRPSRAGPSRLRYQTAIPEFLKNRAEPGCRQSAERWLPLVGKFAIREVTIRWPESYVGVHLGGISDGEIIGDLDFFSQLLEVHGFDENHRIRRAVAWNRRSLEEGLGQVKYVYPKSSANHRAKFGVT